MEFIYFKVNRAGNSMVSLTELPELWILSNLPSGTGVWQSKGCRGPKGGISLLPEQHMPHSVKFCQEKCRAGKCSLHWDGSFSFEWFLCVEKEFSKCRESQNDHPVLEGTMEFQLLEFTACAKIQEENK